MFDINRQPSKMQKEINNRMEGMKFRTLNGTVRMKQLKKTTKDN